jgi:hypothetical protein
MILVMWGGVGNHFRIVSRNTNVLSSLGEGHIKCHAKIPSYQCYIHQHPTRVIKCI